MIVFPDLGRSPLILVMELPTIPGAQERGVRMNLLKNLYVSLTATGPAAIVVVLIVSIAAVGIWGEGPIADRSMTILLGLGCLLLGILAARGL